MADGSGTVPPKDHELVEISGGRSVVVREWSFVKLPELIQYLGKFEKIPFLIEHSVSAEDLARVGKLNNKDTAKIGEAVYRLNVDADLLKNLAALAGKIQELGEGLAPSTP
jgi:hypothetical protein